MENVYDRRERTIYVSGMHQTVTEEHLYELFTKAGPIEKVILKENEDGSPQHALVVFKNVDSVMFAIAYLQSMQLASHPVNIRPLRESSHHSALETAMARMATEQIAVSPPAAYNLRSRPLMAGGGGFSVNGNAYVGAGGGSARGGRQTNTATKVRAVPGQLRGAASATKSPWGASLFSQMYGSSSHDGDQSSLMYGSASRDDYFYYDPSPGGATRMTPARSASYAYTK